MAQSIRLAPITQRHIDEGIAGDCTACPVACALNDAGIYPWAVRPSGIDFGGYEEPETVYTSPFLSSWMFDFDDGRRVAPLTVVVSSDEVCTLAEWQHARRR